MVDIGKVSWCGVAGFVADSIDRAAIEKNRVGFAALVWTILYDLLAGRKFISVAEHVLL